jgi:hypothetical protein
MSTGYTGIGFMGNIEASESMPLALYPKDLVRGLILRCKAKYPYEEMVDFMVCESYDADFGYSLMVVSGYKAGLKFAVLPKESLSPSGFAVSIDWLKENWHEWGYADCLMEDVRVVQNAIPRQK